MDKYLSIKSKHAFKKMRNINNTLFPSNIFPLGRAGKFFA